MEIIERIIKKILCILAALTMIFTLVMMNTINVNAEDFRCSVAEHKHEFHVSGDTLTISATGNNTTLQGNCSINYFLNAHPAITKVVIEDGFTRIDERAFANSTNLTSITIPDSVTSIGTRAFESCSSLTTITIPNGVESIGSYAFYQCSSLTSITIPDSVTSILGCAFIYCSSLTSITIPESVTTIGEALLNCCTNLTSITIQGTVGDNGDGIDPNAFIGFDNTCGSDKVTLTLPDDGIEGPANNTTAWKGGYFKTVYHTREKYSDDITVSWKEGYTPKVGDTIAAVKENIVLSDSGDSGKLKLYKVKIYNASFQECSDTDTLTENVNYYLSPIVQLKDSWNNKLDANNNCYTGNVKVLGTSISNAPAGRIDNGNVNISSANKYAIRLVDYNKLINSDLSSMASFIATPAASIPAASTPAATTATAVVTEWKVGEKKVVNNATLTKLTDTTVSLKNKTIHKSTIKLPSTVTVDNKTYKITSLKRDCVHGHWVKKLVIPSTVTNLEYACFAGDKHLTSIKINSSKLTLAKNLFRHVSKKQRRKIKVTISKNMSKKKFNAVRTELVKQGLKWSNIKRI